MYLSFEITFRLVWYRTPVDINGDKSIHYNQNILTGLYTSNYTIFDQKKKFGKVKIVKALAGLELMTYSFIENALTHCVTLFDNIFRKETN